jgi:hypothetical protein
MRWTQLEYEQYLARQAEQYLARLNSAGGGGGAHTQLQKPQADRAGQAVHGSTGTAADGNHHRGFKITVTFLVSDRRDRDGDGMYSTIQDCLIHAVGRLTNLDRTALRKMAKSIERQRRRSD